MAIKLTDDEDEVRPNDTNNSAGSRFNFSAEDKKTAGIAALVFMVIVGLFKYPKMTIFLLLVAGAVWYYFYGDQELLRSWGVK